MDTERSIGTNREHFPAFRYVFPGDEMIGRLAYKGAMESGYVSSLSTLSGAAESFGLHCDEATVERWRRVGASAGLLDDLLDESPDKDMAYRLYMRAISEGVTTMSDEVPNWVDSRLVTALTLLENSVQILPQSQVNRIQQSALAIGELSRAKSLCENIDEYIDLLRGEAWHTATIVCESTSVEMRRMPGFDAFVTWAHRALELGTLYDSSRDIKRDVYEKRVAVAPSTLNCMRIALHVRSPLFSLLHEPRNRRATQASLRGRLHKIHR